MDTSRLEPYTRQPAVGGSPVFFVGTSGWTYDHWKGVFYPAKLAKSRWFDHYAAQFNAVEVNATYYRAFEDQTYQKWRARAPQGFGYILKTPRVITHLKLLKGVESEVQVFCNSVQLLKETFEMILLQVSPNQPYDLGLLKSTLQAFPDPTRIAVEFRHERWFNQKVEGVLAGVGVTFCCVDSPGQHLTEQLTSDRAYLRLHGHRHWYSDNYTPDDLRQIVSLISRLVAHGARRVYVFFNNDFEGYAPANALALQNLLVQNELADFDRFQGLTPSNT